MAGLAGYGVGFGIVAFAFLKEPPQAVPDLARYQEVSELLDGAAAEGLEQKAEGVGISLHSWKKRLQAQQDSLQRRYRFFPDKLDYETALSRHYAVQMYVFLTGVGVLAASLSFLGLESVMRGDARTYPEFHAAAGRRWSIFLDRHS